ncbi:hypothetical protein [Cytobacillus gottheilii]|uniref:hypothetical protein n=1 Tax=Cytobacillus gottheilii TaxID=859144 RepID=UPI0009BAF707|nr:hypothetical protein [Cytobacillus gottheilii]
MHQLTMKELALIEDEIRAEAITAKTLNWCATQCEDPQVQQMLEAIAESHQLNVANLSQYFNRTKMMQ